MIGPEYLDRVVVHAARPSEMILFFNSVKSIDFIYVYVRIITLTV